MPVVTKLQSPSSKLADFMWLGFSAQEWIWEVDSMWYNQDVLVPGDKLTLLLLPTAIDLRSVTQISYKLTNVCFAVSAASKCLNCVLLNKNKKSLNAEVTTFLSSLMFINIKRSFQWARSCCHQHRAALLWLLPPEEKCSCEFPQPRVTAEPGHLLVSWAELGTLLE